MTSSQPAPAQRVRIVLEDERAVMLASRNVAVVGWRDAPQLEHIRAWHRLGREIARTHPHIGACIDIVERGTPRFGEDVRQAAEEFARDAHIFDLGIGHAIRMPGLGGTAVRAFVQTILLVARPATPTKVASDVAPIIAWMAPRLAPHGWTSESLTSLCDDVRARLR